MPKLLPRTRRDGSAIAVVPREHGIRAFVGRLTEISAPLYRLLVPRGCLFRVVDEAGETVAVRREPRRPWWAHAGSTAVLCDRGDDPFAVSHAVILGGEADGETLRARLAAPWKWSSEVVVLPSGEIA